MGKKADAILVDMTEMTEPCILPGTDLGEVVLRGPWAAMWTRW